jgi:hypothetical protein
MEQFSLSQSDVEAITTKEFNEWSGRMFKEIDESSATLDSFKVLPNYVIQYRSSLYSALGFTVPDMPQWRDTSRDTARFLLYDNQNELIGLLSSWIDIPAGNDPVFGNIIRATPTIVTKHQGSGISTVLKTLMDRFFLDLAVQSQKDVKVIVLDENGKNLRILEGIVGRLQRKKAELSEEELQKLEEYKKELLYKQTFQRHRWESQFGHLGKNYMIKPDATSMGLDFNSLFIDIQEDENRNKVVNYSPLDIPLKKPEEISELILSLRN